MYMGEELRREIEEVVDDRIKNRISPEIKHQIETTLNKKILLIASICMTILLAVIGNIFYNNTQLVKTETVLTEFIKYEKEAHEQLRREIEKNSEKIEYNDRTYYDKLDEISDNQTIIIFGLKQISPNFNLSDVVRSNTIGKNTK